MVMNVCLSLYCALSVQCTEWMKQYTEMEAKVREATNDEAWFVIALLCL